MAVLGNHRNLCGIYGKNVSIRYIVTTLSSCETLIYFSYLGGYFDCAMYPRSVHVFFVFILKATKTPMLVTWNILCTCNSLCYRCLCPHSIRPDVWGSWVSEMWEFCHKLNKQREHYWCLLPPLYPLSYRPGQFLQEISLLIS